jgi:quercetin dioxygenase-like cupin family protein
MPLTRTSTNHFSHYLTRAARMSRTRRIAAAVVIALTTIFVGTALALSNISFTTGTAASFDFGAFGPGYPVPGTVQIQAFTVAPGETFPWHFHKATSYVILVRGTLTEQHVTGPDQCASEEFGAGTAFVESPGAVHTVTNTGTNAAVVWWATVFPQSDGVPQFTPSFKSGGSYPADVPICN